MGFYEVFVRDFKNNLQIVFQFTSDESYLSESACVVLLYDLTNYQSFLNVKQFYFEHAQRTINTDCAFIYLVGNKMDQDNGDDDTAREVDYDEVQEFAQNKGILVNEVSSIKRKNIELVLKMLKTRTGRLLSEHRDLNVILENFANQQPYIVKESIQE